LSSFRFTVKLLSLRFGWKNWCFGCRIENWLNKIGTRKFVKREIHKIKVDEMNVGTKFGDWKQVFLIFIYSRLWYCFNQCITLYIIYYICYMWWTRELEPSPARNRDNERILYIDALNLNRTCSYKSHVMLVCQF